MIPVLAALQVNHEVQLLWLHIWWWDRIWLWQMHYSL